jgi:hypothetical protein
MTKEEMLARLSKLKEELELFVAQANAKISFYNGQISILEELTKDKPAEE